MGEERTFPGINNLSKHNRGKDNAAHSPAAKMTLATSFPGWIRTSLRVRQVQDPSESRHITAFEVSSPYPLSSRLLRWMLTVSMPGICVTPVYLREPVGGG